MGAIPPLNEADWLDAFNKYKAFPQFKLVNAAMTVSEFKFIFFWEWFHRLLGRAIGIAYLLPLGFFVTKYRFTRAIKNQLFLGFFLGLLQGLMGWLMVMSGLVDIPRVSHFRLAAHFMLAIAILGYLTWIILDHTRPQRTLAPVRSNRFNAIAVYSVGILTLIQLTWGAFTAGLKAGFGFNTYPLMNGQWVPLDVFFQLENSLSVFISHPPAVQWGHRTLGLALLVLTLVAWLGSAKRVNFQVTTQPTNTHESSTLSRSFFLVFLATSIQFCLGIATLVLIVPVTLAVTHQLGGVLVFLATVNLMHHYKMTAATSLEQPF